MIAEKMVLNAREAAYYVGVSQPTMLKALADGSVPARRIGRRWLIHREVLKAWMSGDKALAAYRAGRGAT